MPDRADPTTEDARLLGPLIPQRIRAIKRRYFNSQLSKVRAPIAVQLKRKDGELVQDEQDMMKRTGLAKVALEQGRRKLAGLEEKSQVSAPPLPPRRLQTLEQLRAPSLPPPRIRQETDDAQRRVFSPSSKNSNWHRPKTITSRLLRRRYQQILGHSPILVVEEQASAPAASTKLPFLFSVAQSPFAKGAPKRVPEASAEDQWWTQQGEEMSSGKAARRVGQSRSKA